MPSSSASAQACSGPRRRRRRARSSRGSRPRSTVITRSARAISALATAHDAERGLRARRGPSSRAERRRAPPRRAPRSSVTSPPSTAPSAEVAEHEVRVGHRRLLAAAAVAGRAGLGARRARADPQRAAGVEPRDRAAAGADRVHVDHRQPDRHARDHRLGRRPAPRRRPRRDVGARAAHVEGEHVLEAARARDVRRADDAAGRPGEHARRRPRGRRRSTSTTPPEDCMTQRRAARARCQVRRAAAGARYAFATVVEQRSYSRNSGSTSLRERDVHAGQRRAQRLADRAARAPGAGTRRAGRPRRPRPRPRAAPRPPPAALASSSGTSTPSGPIRSRTVKRSSRGTSGGGPVAPSGRRATAGSGGRSRARRGSPRS